jgi:hypothetical protein
MLQGGSWRVQIDDVGLFIRPLCSVITWDSPIVIEPDPLCFLVEPVTNQDMEVGDLTIVECVAGGGLVESVLVVEDVLLEVVDPVFVPLHCNGSGGFSIGDGL